MTTTTARRRNTFTRQNTTYKCDVCGRLTRHTGAQALGSQLCPQCWELAGIENEICDGYRTLAEAETVIAGYVKEIKDKGGDTREWDRTFQQSATE